MVGDGTLDWRENGSTGNTLDKETGRTASVATKALGGNDEDDWILNCHHRICSHQAGDSTNAVKGAHEGGEEGAKGGADHEEEGCRKDG